MMKKITSLLLLWVMVLPLWAQFHDPVSFLFPKRNCLTLNSRLFYRKGGSGLACLFYGHSGRRPYSGYH